MRALNLQEMEWVSGGNKTSTGLQIPVDGQETGDQGGAPDNNNGDNGGIDPGVAAAAAAAAAARKAGMGALTAGAASESVVVAGLSSFGLAALRVATGPVGIFLAIVATPKPLK